MADYVRFPTSFWYDLKVRKADPDLALLRAFYMSHPQQTIDGISRCSDGHVAEYLRFTKPKVAKLRRQLMDDGFIVFDETTDEMYLLGFLVANPPRFWTNAVALQSNIDRLQSEAVKTAVMADVGTTIEDRIREGEEQKARKKRTNGADFERSNSGFAPSAGNVASSALERSVRSRGWKP